MRPSPKQREAIDSDSSLTLFGFTSGSGMTVTALEIIKRLVNRGENIYFLKKSPIYQYFVDELSKLNPEW